jgi:hypothetical protein
MPQLHIALQDGFSKDTVQIQVGARQVFRKEGVTTRTQIGFADAVDVEAAGQVAVAISLPARRASQTVTLTVDRPTYLGVSVAADGTITATPSHEPFRYA